jgi:hypothetical protein
MTMTWQQFMNTLTTFLLIRSFVVGYRTSRLLAEQREAHIALTKIVAKMTGRDIP